MTVNLRWYQNEAVDSFYNYFASKSGNPIAALPTGTGKSIVLAEFLRRIYKDYPQQRVLILTHVKELIQQDYDELKSLWEEAPCGIYSAGLGIKQIDNPITFAGIASIHRKVETFGHIDLIFVDECHLVPANKNTMYRKLIDGLKKINPKLKVIGLSATPFRLGLGLLTEGGLFTDVCYDLCTPEGYKTLIEEGYLVPLVTKKTALQYDVSRVGTRGGEYIESELQEVVNRTDLTSRACGEIVRLGANRQHWIIFAAGISHTVSVAEELKSLGVSAVAVHSELTKQERDEAISGFKSGKYRAIVNNNILTTGFNFPPTDLIGFLRPTKSAGLWIQANGRGMRPYPNKVNCLVLDFAGNTRVLGPVDDPFIAVKGKSSGRKMPLPMKVCPDCQTYNHPRANTCVECKYVFPPPRKMIHLDVRASDLNIMRAGAAEEKPVETQVAVSRVSYKLHFKMGKPPSLHVTYHCGLLTYSEWVCLEHQGYAKQKAAKWWATRSIDNYIPKSVMEALSLTGTLKVPSSILVSIKSGSPYPNILKVYF